MMKHKAARVTSRLDELMFGAFNVRTAAINGVNVIGHIDTLLRPCAPRGPDGTELSKSSHLDTASISAVIAAGSKAGKGNMGLEWR